MPANIIVGSQWGDEGKGKIIDIMASRAEVVVRATGGNNAGHTVVNHGEVYKLHLIPSGILYPDTLCLIGAGVVLDPKDFISELDNLESRGISTANLKIDPRAHFGTFPHTVGNYPRRAEPARPQFACGVHHFFVLSCYCKKHCLFLSLTLAFLRKNCYNKRM